MNARSVHRTQDARHRAKRVHCGQFVAVGLLLVGWTGVARANGAFPDEFSVHLPVGSPHRIFLGTNFGLIISEDDGATWRYVCEPYVVGASANAILYQLAPDGAMLAASLGSLTRSADDGCTWTHGGGTVSALNLTDFFVDPNDPTFVLAIAQSLNGSAIYPSHDGGLTFGAALYSTPSFLTGVEISASIRGVVYATLSGASSDAGPSGSLLLRSPDYGATWISYPLDIPVGTEARIAAVDPDDANTVYLRVLTSTTDALAITTDGGKTLGKPVVSISGTVLSAFLRASDGAIYVGTPGGDLYVRPVGATNFTLRPGPRLRCLGQRPGTSRIFACGDAFIDGFNLGYSDDGGQTFKPLLRFNEIPPQQLVGPVPRARLAIQTPSPPEISGPLTCPPVPQACAAHWALLQTRLGIQPDAGPPVPDAGGGGGSPRQQKSGCSSTDGGTVALLGLMVFLLLLGRLQS